MLEAEGRIRFGGPDDGELALIAGAAAAGEFGDAQGRSTGAPRRSTSAICMASGLALATVGKSTW